MLCFLGRKAYTQRVLASFRVRLSNWKGPQWYMCTTVARWGMVIPASIGNPHIAYIHTYYYWVDGQPQHRETMGVECSPETYEDPQLQTCSRWFCLKTRNRKPVESRSCSQKEHVLITRSSHVYLERI